MDGLHVHRAGQVDAPPSAFRAGRPEGAVGGGILLARHLPVVEPCEAAAVAVELAIHEDEAGWAGGVVAAGTGQSREAKGRACGLVGVMSHDDLGGGDGRGGGQDGEGEGEGKGSQGA